MLLAQKKSTLDHARHAEEANDRGTNQKFLQPGDRANAIDYVPHEGRLASFQLAEPKILPVRPGDKEVSATGQVAGELSEEPLVCCESRSPNSHFSRSLRSTVTQTCAGLGTRRLRTETLQ